MCGCVQRPSPSRRPARFPFLQLKSFFARLGFNVQTASLSSPRCQLALREVIQRVPVEMRFEAIVCNDLAPTPHVNLKRWNCEYRRQVFDRNERVVPLLVVAFLVLYDAFVSAQRQLGVSNQFLVRLVSGDLAECHRLLRLRLYSRSV